MKLKNWIRIAEGYYETAKLLEDPRLAVGNTKADTFASSWYLLHHSMELYLKAHLIHRKKYSKTNSRIHDLDELAKKSAGLVTAVDNALNEVVKEKPVKNWLHFINVFGFPNGGVRYLQSQKKMYAAPLGVSYYFSNLVNTITDECKNDEQEIDQII